LEQFIRNAQTDIDKILSDLELTTKNFAELVPFFGEDIKDNDPESFFGKWKVFLNNVFDARKKLVEAREIEEKKKMGGKRGRGMRGGTSTGGGENTEGGTNTGGENTGGENTGGENTGGERGMPRGRPRGGPRGGRGMPGMGGQVVDELFSKLKEGGILKKRNNNN